MKSSQSPLRTSRDASRYGRRYTVMRRRLVVEAEAGAVMADLDQPPAQSTKRVGRRRAAGSRQSGSTAGASGFCANACSMSVSSSS